jgi:hypothetical protein
MWSDRIENPAFRKEVAKAEAAHSTYNFLTSASGQDCRLPIEILVVIYPALSSSFRTANPKLSDT